MDNWYGDVADLPTLSLPNLAVLLSGIVGDGRTMKYGWKEYSRVGRGATNGIWKRTNTNQQGALQWSSYAIPPCTTKYRFTPIWSTGGGGNDTSNYGANGGETIALRIRDIANDRYLFGNLSDTVNAAFTEIFLGSWLSEWETLGSDESHWTGFWVKLENPEFQPTGEFIKATSIQLIRVDDAIVKKEQDPLTGDDVINLEFVGRMGTVKPDTMGKMHATMTDNVGSNVNVTASGAKQLDTPIYVRFNEDTTLAFKVGTKQPKRRPTPPAPSTLLGGVSIINFPFSGV